jgi:hypothetical protein
MKRMTRRIFRCPQNGGAMVEQRRKLFFFILFTEKRESGEGWQREDGEGRGES